MKPISWTARTIQLILADASQEKLSQEADLCAQHGRILSGEECPQCSSRDVVSNHTSGQCKDCGIWEFDEWQCVRVENGLLVQSAESS